MRRAPLGLVLALAIATPLQAAPSASPPPHATHAAATPARPKPRPAATVAHRPLTLAAQNILGRSEGARVLFVHTGPTIALEDAPKHPSYLRDDFTAALSSPVTVHVRNLSPLRTPTIPGGSR